MTLDNLPMSAVGKKITIDDGKSHHEGYLTSFRAESDVITSTNISSDIPVATYFGPTTYYFTVLVGATTVYFTTTDQNIQIDLVKE